MRAARRGAGIDDQILVEGFIPGREVAVEGVLTNGTLQVFAIFDKPDPLDGPFFEETIYVTPSSLDRTAQDALAAAVARGAAALGLRHGAIHAECRLAGSGVFVLEIAARPIGGLCSRALRFDAAAGARPARRRRGRSKTSCCGMRSATDVAGVRREAAASAVMMIPIPRRGVLKGVQGEAEAMRGPARRGRRHHREAGSVAGAAARSGQLSGVHLRAGASVPGRRKRRCGRRMRACVSRLKRRSIW